MAHDHDHSHDDSHVHDEDGEAIYGMVFGIRTLVDEGRLYLAEVEVAPYVDEPAELGATLVFHALEWIDPSADEDDDVPAWTIDIDDDLIRRTSAPLSEQFTEIVQQLHELSTAQLGEYLAVAREGGAEG